MSTLGENAKPWGAPEVAPEPGSDSFYEASRPRLGGLATPIPFSDQQLAVLDAVADTMIPAGEGFPAPSEVDVATFVRRYITPSGYKNKHFPFASEDTFKAGLDKLGSAFVKGDIDKRTVALEAMEETKDPVFEQLRALVYYGYYSRPEVVQAIRRNVPAAKDYHGPPLPYGYLESTEEWTDELLAAAGKGGHYLKTEEVTRVDLSNLSWKK